MKFKKTTFNQSKLHTVLLFIGALFKYDDDDDYYYYYYYTVQLVKRANENSSVIV